MNLFWSVPYKFQIEPHNQVCLTAKGELLGKLGKTEEALDIFDKSYQINPNDVVAQNAAANLLAKSGRLEEAIEKYKDIRKQPGKNNPYTLCGLGFLLLRRDKDNQDILEARQMFEQAQKIPGSEDLASLGLWVAHARLGDKTEALKFKKFFEENN